MKYLLMIVTALAMIGTATATSRVADAVVAADAARRPLLREIAQGLSNRKLAGEKPAEVFRIFNMLKTFLTFILVATIGSALLAQTPTPTPESAIYLRNAPEVVRDHPGKCPKCGMELVPGLKKGNIQHRTSNIQHRMQRRFTLTERRDELPVVRS